ncbi:ADP-ribosylglycohydrolase family protein [Nocardia bhagyanarayanae]|uniref:non-specific serine/threonine protein kinase n=1 Tax=Nocardia bhagyanarayanae TaxID=1215925 RepID=A0A543FAL1_9NOCA|nr:ADP-ribosylglycohydrolase family protein [Nocardia bhagyanarayanae]TQM30855.1 serine/threonine protein kinase [Nocardia bhagyanarayanae]
MLRRGEVFAGYVIERELGRGGMGAVYAARHPRLPKTTALKLLHREMFDDAEIRRRFEREADLVAQLDHPNIITVYDRGIEDERLWISMQYVDGHDSAAVPPSAMSPERVAQIVVQTAGALDYAHARGVLHRDVKPANILLSRSAGVGTGFDERVLLTDFGIAKLLDDTAGLTRTGNLTATLAYAAPEQLTNAPLDHRCDQYALACTLFRLLTGAGPYDGPNLPAVLFGHLHGPIPSPRAMRPELPARLDSVLARGMAKDPGDRYDSCGEFAEDVVRALRDRGFGGAPERAGRPASGSAVGTSSEPPAARSASPDVTMHATEFRRRMHTQDDVVLGCLLGGAIGDALGAPVENMLLHHIRQRYGPQGVTGTPEHYAGEISEETQLTLFTVEALVKGSVRARSRGIGGATLGMMQQGFLVWLRGQGVTIPEQRFPPHSALASHPELMRHRGTTHAAVTALRKAAARGEPARPLGTRSQPINDSKGCAATVRSVPCGFGYAVDRAGDAIEHVFELGCDAAALTHGHPSGWLPAGAMAALIYLLGRGTELDAALDQVRTELARHEHHEETSAALAAAIELAAATARRTSAMPQPEDFDALGRGWIAPEALGIAVYAALCAQGVGGTPERIFRHGVLLAVNHSGDSDATGALCGSILGARHGRAAIPEPWRAGLDAAPIIERLAADYCIEFGPTPPRDRHGEPTSDWSARYPD